MSAYSPPPTTNPLETFETGTIDVQSGKVVGLPKIVSFVETVLSDAKVFSIKLSIVLDFS